MPRRRRGRRPGRDLGQHACSARRSRAELVGAADVRVDLRVLAFAGAAVLLAAALAGVFPAVGAVRGNMHATLIDRGAGGQRGRRRALGALVAVEFALALVLAVGAGLMIRTFANLSAEDPGFVKDGVLSVRVVPPASMTDGAIQRRFWREVLDRIDALPGVQSAGASHLLPFDGSNYVNNLLIDGRPLPDGEPPREIDWRSITPGYIETLRVPLLRGRLFTTAEHESAEQLILINETAASRYFPNEDPIGQRARTQVFESDWATIVGVVGDTKDQTLAAPVKPQMYRLHAPFTAGMTLMVRTVGDPMDLAGPIRELIRSIAPDVVVADMQPLAHVASASIARPRLLTALLSGFGVLALLLGAVGLYGVMAYGTVQRTREFGVRLALGARTGEVLRLVARDAIRLAGIGVGLGTGGRARADPAAREPAVRRGAGRSAGVRRRGGAAGGRRGGRRAGAGSARRTDGPDGGAALGVARRPRTRVVSFAANREVLQCAHPEPYSRGKPSRASGAQHLGESNARSIAIDYSTSWSAPAHGSVLLQRSSRARSACSSRVRKRRRRRPPKSK